MENNNNELYYTPNIEEFHVGFEYIENDTKEKVICDGSLIHFLKTYSQDLANTRVKYLDKEDIESLGFKYDNNSEPIPPRKDSLELPTAFFIDRQLITGQLWILYWYRKDNIIWIDYTKDCAGEGYLFKGIIKNKSELKTLLKQLEII